MKYFAKPGGLYLGTFLIFFMLFIMGACWWIGLSYDYIFKSVRECAELRREIDSSGKSVDPKNAELAEAYALEADRANHRMHHTISGRLVARMFNFQRVRGLEE